MWLAWLDGHLTRHHESDDPIGIIIIYLPVSLMMTPDSGVRTTGTGTSTR